MPKIASLLAFVAVAAASLGQLNAAFAALTDVFVDPVGPVACSTASSLYPAAECKDYLFWPSHPLFSCSIVAFPFELKSAVSAFLDKYSNVSPLPVLRLFLLEAHFLPL